MWSMLLGKKRKSSPISNPHSSYNTLKPEELGYKQKFPKKYAREIHFPAELTENEMRQRAILQDLDEKEQHLDHLKKSQRVVYIDKPVEKEDVVREPVDIQKVPKIPYSEYGQCNEAEFRNPVATPETPEEVVIYKHLNGTNKAYSKEIFDNIQRDICNHNAWLLSREGKANDQCATKMEEYNKQLAVLDDQIKSEKAAMNNLRRKQQRAIDLNENRLTKTFLLQTQQFTAEKNKIYKETERLNFAIRKHQDKNRQGILPDDASHDTVTVEETVYV
ncbi:uncharacterized protein KNAG_0A07940 [Huiozyma naganishii CBS 8797]|uniref:Uncharacterized protein n=1 Tax=Huiozyma naganishii (strain ATCC MYA-139 / BCRC 22969 / CBS 8797 / KCTC 17520 / NBRC 10181 / NCYC 3082 / Yp74L-3) TaxID=1071383 RepID=J7RUE2_HUIN7|nr:hypothetical protein KNAG_0A07940 [Kazachstania naganishii CBS 8797]CCK68447.1 hypothetical protein KNAG_0A07940 [Kazachstania naganishii CBS 8797]